MRYSEFLEQFALVAHEFYVDEDGLIRNFGFDDECPITRVCRATTSFDYDIVEVEDAANELNLDPALADELVDTADNNNKKDAPGWITHYSPHTRRDLEALIKKGNISKKERSRDI